MLVRERIWQHIIVLN